MTTEERLAKVERELGRAKRRNQWLVAVVGLAVVGLILAWTWSKTTATTQAQAVGGAEKVIRANTFIVEDANGKELAKLAVGPTGPVLGLKDANGKTRAMLFVDEAGPVLSLSDEDGEERASLSVGKNGPGLGLSDENGKVRVVLSVFKDKPTLGLVDEAGKPIWSAP